MEPGKRRIASPRPVAAALFVARLASDAAWQRTMEEVLKTHGKLHIVVNSAGISFARPVWEMTLGQSWPSTWTAFSLAPSTPSYHAPSFGRRTHYQCLFRLWHQCRSR